jgi:hypothetical protein
VIPLTDFRYLRTRKTADGRNQIQASVTDHGPWFRLTKKELAILNRAATKTAADLDAVVSTNATPDE